MFTEVERIEEADESISVQITWQSRPNRDYAIFSSPDMQTWFEITDNHPAGGESTSYKRHQSYGREDLLPGRGSAALAEV